MADDRDYRWIVLRPGCGKCEEITAWRKAHSHMGIKDPQKLLVNRKRLFLHDHA